MVDASWGCRKPAEWKRMSCRLACECGSVCLGDGDGLEGDDEQQEEARWVGPSLILLMRCVGEGEGSCR